MRYDFLLLNYLRRWTQAVKDVRHCIFAGHTDTLESSPVRWMPHIQSDRIFPWAKILTGQTSRSPPCLCLSLPSMSKHTLLTSRLQILSSHQWSHQTFRGYSLPGHETTHIWTHTWSCARAHTRACVHTHTYRTYMCTPRLKQRNRPQISPGVPDQSDSMLGKLYILLTHFSIVKTHD